LAVPVPAGTLRFPEGVAEVSMVPPHPELAPAPVLASWTELVEVPQQDLPQQGVELTSASPVPEQARPWPLLRALVSVPQVGCLVLSSLQPEPERPSVSPVLA
jgi:hypothetical protein